MFIVLDGIEAICVFEDVPMQEGSALEFLEIRSMMMSFHGRAVVYGLLLNFATVSGAGVETILWPTWANVYSHNIATGVIWGLIVGTDGVWRSFQGFRRYPHPLLGVETT